MFYYTVKNIIVHKFKIQILLLFNTSNNIRVGESVEYTSGIQSPTIKNKSSFIGSSHSKNNCLEEVNQNQY